MITIEQKGDFSKLTSYFQKLKHVFKVSDLDKYGKAGVEALMLATPKDTGKTATSWSYEVVINDDSASIIFNNSNMTRMNIPVAILIQYGHGTRNGGYVQGIDYINPALRPVFQQMADEIWEEAKET